MWSNWYVRIEGVVYLVHMYRGVVYLVRMYRGVVKPRYAFNNRVVGVVLFFALTKEVWFFYLNCIKGCGLTEG